MVTLTRYASKYRAHELYQRYNSQLRTIVDVCHSVCGFCITSIPVVFCATCIAWCLYCNVLCGIKKRGRTRRRKKILHSPSPVDWFVPCRFWDNTTQKERTISKMAFLQPHMLSPSPVGWVCPMQILGQHNAKGKNSQQNGFPSTTHAKPISCGLGLFHADSGTTQCKRKEQSVKWLSFNHTC